MSKILVLTAFLFAFAGLAAGSTLYLKSDTPVLAAPELGAKVIALTQGGNEYEIIAVKRYMLRQHPFGRYFDFSQIKLADGRMGWICPELMVMQQNGKPVIGRGPPNNLTHQCLAISCSAIILALVLYFVLDKLFPVQARRLGLKAISPLERSIGLLALLISVRYLELMLLFAHDSHLVTLSPDGNTYFNMARDIVNLNFHNPWDRSIGACFIYIPFILLFPEAKTFVDVAPQLAMFNALVLMPLCFVMGFFILRKVCGSEFKSFFALLLWIVIPFFYFIVHDLDKQIFGGIFRLPYLGVGWNLYCIHQAFSFNNLIDAFSTFCVFGVVFLGLFLPPRWWMAAAVSALFGVACLVRLNNIFFAPLVAFIFWRRFNSFWTDWRSLLRYVAGSVFCFLAAFGIQFVFNKLHVGAIYKFPYALINADSGFTLKDLPYNTHYLIGCNYLFFVLGAWGIIFCREKKSRNFLALMAFPTAIFFCGLANTSTDPVRYILSIYLPLLTAGVVAAPWRELKRTTAWILGIMIGASALLYQPMCFKWLVLPSGIAGNYWTGIAALALCAATLAGFGRNLKFLLYAGSFMLLYYLNNPWLLFAAMLALLAYAGFDFTCAELAPRMRQLLTSARRR